MGKIPNKFDDLKTKELEPKMKDAKVDKHSSKVHKVSVA